MLVRAEADHVPHLEPKVPHDWFRVKDNICTKKFEDFIEPEFISKVLSQQDVPSRWDKEQVYTIPVPPSVPVPAPAPAAPAAAPAAPAPAAAAPAPAPALQLDSVAQKLDQVV